MKVVNKKLQEDLFWQDIVGLLFQEIALIWI